jgi:hypothetical protein
MRVLATIFGVIFFLAHSAYGLEYEWLSHDKKRESLHERYKAPRGFKRVEVDSNSFAGFLRHLPLKPKSAVVRDHERKRLFAPYAAAIIDLDIGGKDLQQCADTLIRLYAEYQRSAGNAAALSFKFTSGHGYAYADYLEGKRAVVRGNKVGWRTVAARREDRAAFRDWLDVIFMYAGTASLARDLEKVRHEDARIGDLFITPGFPGHTVMIADIVENSAGGRRMLLIEGFTPAQDAHVVKASIFTGGVWHELEDNGGLELSFWSFSPNSLRRF